MGQTPSQYKALSNFKYENFVQVSINGNTYKVTSEIPSDTSLNEYIREHAHLKGTKFMCQEGGCGACIVSVQSAHAVTGHSRSYSVNSCLVPIFACHGWAITTIEGLGSQAAGYHNLQKRLAAASGTQCGYCSPGMVMNMNSLLEGNENLTAKDIENSFGGNICRCTGYRPILDAFKSFGKDAPNEIENKLVDIENLHLSQRGSGCSGLACGNKCSGYVCVPTKTTTRIGLEWSNNQNWYRPISVREVYEIFDMIGDSSYRLVSGQTGHGVYRYDSSPQVLIDINGVPELHVSSVTPEGIILGANISLTETMEFLSKVAEQHPDRFGYCEQMRDHIDLVANVPIRNLASIVGNLSLKHQHPEFPSDIFLLLVTIRATLTIGKTCTARNYFGEQLVVYMSAQQVCSYPEFLPIFKTKEHCIVGAGSVTGVRQTMELQEYLATDMRQKLVENVILPPHDNHTVLRTYKIMPRAQNSHAIVNAGFLFQLNQHESFKVISKPTIVFGGISPQFVDAHKTEDLLVGKSLLSEATLKEALETLEGELQPDHLPSDLSPEYRKGLALSLLYKFVLSIDPSSVDEKHQSGGSLLERALSRGSQDFDTDQNLWPLNQPVPKIEGLIQCSGEAEFTNDLPQMPNEVWAELVLCDRAAGLIKNVDPSEALKMPGVIGFFGPDDIIGDNSFNPIPGEIQDEIFVRERTRYAGQALGVVVAERRAIAAVASKAVKVVYSKCETPVLDVRKVVDARMADRINEFAQIAPTKKKDNVKFTLSGKWDLATQYHFTMETLTCVVIPTENQLEVHASTQHPAGVQAAVSRALNMPAHRINVITKRVGGAYGCKLDRPNHTSAVCALAAHLLHRPVRMVLSLETNIEWMGKRLPNLCEYEAGVDEEGEIQYLDASIYQGNGHVPSKFIALHSLKHAGNGYDMAPFNLKMYGVITDNAWNTWCRAPGSTEHISMMENVMEHIATVVNKDPISVRLANIEDGAALPKMIQETMTSADYYKRLEKVDEFNQVNRWKKRGLNLSSMSYPFNYRAHFHAHVAIFAGDGTVAISHGGVEMGQGINTKAAQVTAKCLGIGLDMISIRPLTTFESPNNSRTGGCQGTDSVCYAITKCCDELNRRLAPIKAKLGANADWRTIVNAADSAHVNLRHSYMFTPNDEVEPYDVYGVVVTEVEVDILTGQFQILRVDLHEDAGQCISPEIDIGQVEGSFVMGIGYYTSEEMIYDQQTGAVLSNRSWNYKPPGAKDIPADFRITLRKNAFNTKGTLGSKATGEPPFCLSCSVAFAIRNAVASARKDAGIKETWFEMHPPYTVEKIWMACKNTLEAYTR